MYLGNYLGGHYFGGGYFAGLAGFADFWESFVAWWRADPDLASAFPGGLYNARASARAAYPYARVTESYPQDPLSADDQPFSCTVSAYANSDDDAMRLALLVRKKLADTASRGRFSYAGWRESGHESRGSVDLVPLPDGPGGVPVWRADAGFRFWVVATTTAAQLAEV